MTLTHVLFEEMKDKALHASICKSTDDTLVLQVAPGDDYTSNELISCLKQYDAEFQPINDPDGPRINMYIGGDRVFTLIINQTGIDPFYIEERTGLMHRVEGLGHLQLPRLVRPSREFLYSCREASQEYYDIGLQGFTPDPSDDDFWRDTFLETLEDAAANNEFRTASVPQFTFWLVHDDTYIGSVRLRKRLTADLWNDLGGTLNFEVRPSCWSKGYGTLMLGLAVQRAPKLGLDTLIGCVEEKECSASRILRKNGGLLIQHDNTPGFRYIIPTVLREEMIPDFSRFE